IVASATGATSATFNLTNTAGGVNQGNPPATSTPQSVFAGAAVANLAGTLKEASGNLVTKLPRVFTAPPPSGVRGTFSNGTNTITVNSDGTGIASVPFTANGNASGTAYNVTATANGVTGTFVLTNKAGSPSKILPVAGTTPQSAQLTKPFGTLLAA